MKKYTPPLYLLLLAFTTYGLFFWQRGFYWDESPWSWIYYRLGPEMLTQTFSTSRPFWGMIYQIMLPLVGPYPVRWQLLVILIHWLAAAQVWWLIRQLWPKQDRLAFVTGALFLVYPGLGQNFLGLMYSHFYIVFNFLLLSFNLSLLALSSSLREGWSSRRSNLLVANRGLLREERPRNDGKDEGVVIRHSNLLKPIPLTLLALIFSVANLLTMEYFYFMELGRVVLFWIALRGEPKRLQKSALWFAPYLLAMVAVTLWRAFFFENQNASYSFTFLSDLKDNPLAAIADLLGNMARSFWATVPQAWTLIFAPTDASVLGPRTLAVAAVVLVAAAVGVGWALLRWPKSTSGEALEWGEWFGLAWTMWILAGGSFWLVGLVPELKFSNDRFTLPFMLGSSLLLTGVVETLRKWKWAYVGAFAILVGFSAAHHQQLDATFRHDWEVQRGLFNQMSWRIPGLKPETILLSNDLPMEYSSDNSLSGPLNWMYSPPGEMNAILYFASFRVGTTLPNLEPGQPHELDYRGPIFRGNTSNILVVNFEPPGCFRVIDPYVEADNRLLPVSLRDVIPNSNPSVILFEQQAIRPKQLYGAEPEHGWCYYFERAELARQMGDWEEVVRLAEVAFGLNDHPNDPVERFVFIEGYAHAGEWARAQELSMESYRVSREYMSPMLCRLWERISETTEPDGGQKEAVEGMRAKFGCEVQ
jgi:hypothetical protein